MAIEKFQFETIINNSEYNFSEYFFMPLLKNSVLYLRGVGYFSSSWIRRNMFGLIDFVNNGGIIKWIISPILDKNDWKAIKLGDKARNNEILKNTLDQEVSDFEKSLNNKTLSAFSWMISDRIIDLKLVLPKNKLSGEFHSKFGYFEDSDGNSLSFQGSNNESAKSFNNYEQITIFNSWNQSKGISCHANNSKIRFLKIWNDQDTNLEVYNIPDSIKEKIVKLRDYSNRPYDINKHKKVRNLMVPRIPDKFEDVRDYQKKAYHRWRDNNFQGLFAMATGTGKTVTALYSALEEFNQRKINNAGEKYQVIVLVPTKTLVEQWENEIKNFYFHSIIKVYSDSHTWRNDLRQVISDRKFSDIESNYFIISTYRSFINSYKKFFSKLSSDTLLIADEVHNMGSPRFLEILNNIIFKKRIGLSATPKRIYSPESSERISNFFNTEYPYTFSFSMKEAISAGILTEYYYFPETVELTDKEFEEYLKLTKKISKFANYEDENSKGSIKNSILERLLIKRKRIINGAEQKKQKLLDIIKSINSDKMIELKYCIVYSPAGYDYFYDNIEDDEESIRLINQMSILVNNEFPYIPQNQYISEIKDKESVIRSFRKGVVDLLFAINCLDEGVDIPQTKIGIFTSSTGNPRQFIQRRGRLLRKHSDKQYAYIYDMIVVPPRTGGTFKEEKKMIINELKRVKYFLESSRNFTQFENFFGEICDHYLINYNSIDIDEEML